MVTTTLDQAGLGFEPRKEVNTVTTADGTRIYYKDWGSGSRLSSAMAGRSTPMPGTTRCSSSHRMAIARDRRGHGRSSQPWNGNEMDTYADDLATLIETLDLRDAVLVGHSTGGGEVARYIGRHGTSRVAGAVLVGAVTPLMLKTESNPNGTPIEAFDAIRAGVSADRSQFYKDLSVPFYGYNRSGAKVSQGVRDAFWLMSMQVGLRGAYECIKAFSETDQRF